MLDPDTSKDYLDRVQNRSKEKKYAYDVAFGAEAKNAVIHCQVLFIVELQYYNRISCPTLTKMDLVYLSWLVDCWKYSRRIGKLNRQGLKM